MSWWYLQNLKHERELKELKRAREVELQEQQDYKNNKTYEDLMSKYSDFSLDDAMLEVWREMISYVGIEKTEKGFIMTYEWMADEPDENGLDVYIVEEMSFPFTLEEMEDDSDFYGLNIEKALEMYWGFGLTIPFTFEDFSIFIRKELNEYSDTILW